MVNANLPWGLAGREEK